jgi:hypothetical protein
MRRRKRLLFVGGLLAVVCVAARIGYAAIPDGNVITSCYKNAGGSLRVIDVAETTDCKPGETKLVWGQQGPKGDKGDKGDQGQQGEKGDKGDTGPAGSAPVFTNYGSGSLQDIAEGDVQTVASVTLPTGNYTLSATVAVIGDGARFGQCVFDPTPPVNGTVALAEVHDVGLRLPLIGDVSVTTSQLIVRVRCTGLDGDIKAAGALIATRVGTITPSE